MPIQTIGRKPKRPPSRSLKVDLCSLLHRVLDLGDAGVQVDVLALDLARAPRGPRRAWPTEIRKRGRLGDREGEQAVERRPGSTMTPSIHCQASRPGELAALVAVGEVAGCPS